MFHGLMNALYIHITIYNYVQRYKIFIYKRKQVNNNVEH